ncbi:MAG: HEAT repeat domain-containing protein [Deltaproteobacteria bacterium]|nr:HEAT repeat domain-containing protein [Deltaproteobacteria bacterium]MBN2670053.1 HEAT repeat domain-containing protein [Deltaproteobacteria bacterium]
MNEKEKTRVLCKVLFGAAFLSVWFAAASAWAAKTLALEDGAVLTVDAHRIQLTRDKKILFETPIEVVADKADIQIASVSASHTAFLVTIAGDPVYRLLGIRTGDTVELIWKEAVVYRGDVGEQWATDVRLLDLDGDGVIDIVKGILYQGVRLCGHTAAPLLFREKYDVKKKEFVPTQGGRSIQLKTSLEPDVKTEVGPLQGVQFLTADSVSSSVGDDRNPLLLTPPFSLVDGRSESGWTAGSGNGVGEFASFTTLSSEWKVTAVGIRVASQDVSAKKKRNSDRFSSPPSVMVSLSHSAYRLRLPSDEGLYWFMLPVPQQTTCLSVILEDPGARNQDPMALFEVQVRTELDSPDGLKKLVAQLDDDDLGEQAKTVLRSLGKSVYAAIAVQWKKLSVQGKRRAVRLIAEIAPEQGVSLLVSAAMGDSSFILDDILSALAKTKGRGEVVLAKYLKNRSAKKFFVAVQLLVDLNSDAGFEQLVQAVGMSEDAMRKKELLAAIGQMTVDAPHRAANVLAAADAARQNDDIATMFQWLAIAVETTSAAEEAALMARDVYAISEFENQYRALRIIAAAKELFSIQFFQQVAKSENKFLRYLVAGALAAFGDSAEAVAVLTQLAGDNEPLVQIEALTSLLKSKNVAKQDSVTAAGDSLWPQVRALAVLNSVHLPKVKKQMVTNGLSDDSEIVVMEALRVSTTIDDHRLDSGVTGIMTASKHAALLERSAQVAGARCQNDDATLDALFELLRMGAEPLANSTEKVIAVAAARSLGQIGSPLAVKHLKKAREHSNLTTDRAIDTALAHAKDGCAAK